MAWIFSVRGSRRFKQRRKGSSRLWLYILAAVLILLSARSVYQKKDLPVTAVNDVVTEESTQQERFGETFFLRILSFVIPGINEVNSEIYEPENSGISRLQELALPDLRNPKLLIFAQIPYLSDPGITVQPLITETEEETIPDKPRIIIPVRGELTGAGKVLIYHTHTTESFVPTSGERFTEDLSMTVAQLGDELSELLKQKYAIPVIRNTVIHDIPRDPAYQVARSTLEQELEDNHDIALVVDLHRDGIDNKSLITSTLNGQSAARILLVVGTRYEGWENNREKARFLHEALEEIAPGISRGVKEQPFVYNQDLHPGSLLIEVGGHLNSMEEARRTLPVLAEALSRLYTSGQM